MEAPAVTLRKGPEDGAQAPLALIARQLLFRVVRGIGECVSRVGGRFRTQATPRVLPLLQCEVVPDLKDPTSEVRTGTAESHVSKQCEEDLLHHIVGRRRIEAERHGVAPKARRALVEEPQDLVPRLRVSVGGDGSSERERARQRKGGMQRGFEIW